MLWPIYFGRFKSIPILCIFYWVNICGLGLDFSPLLFWFVNFLIKDKVWYPWYFKFWSTSCLSNSFFLWTDFLSIWNNFYSRNVKMSSMFFLFRINIFISQNCSVFSPWFLQCFGPFKQEKFTFLHSKVTFWQCFVLWIWNS